MARLLCVWEQGGQLGHLNRLKLPIEVALQMGHEVFLAARELRHVKSVLGDLPVTVLQAPFKQNIENAGADQYLSYTHLIARQCFSDADELDALCGAWRGLYDLVQPQAVLFEHSPTALVAALPYGFKKVLIGQGFMLPPAPESIDAPFAVFPTTPDTPQAREALLKDDAALLGCINQSLERSGGLHVRHVYGIYAQADHTFCMTWPAMDPFGPRTGLHYLGAPSMHLKRAPEWPHGGGPKVFGYLQMFLGLPQLIQDLAQAGVNGLLCVRDAPADMVAAHSQGPVRITTEPVDIHQIALQARFVINHANHSTVATLCAAGVPQLLIPRFQEQLFLALQLVRQGCAAMAFQDQTGFSNAVTAMLNQPSIALQAKQMASVITPFDENVARQHMRETFAKLLKAS